MNLFLLLHTKEGILKKAEMLQQLTYVVFAFPTMEVNSYKVSAFFKIYCLVFDRKKETDL